MTDSLVVSFPAAGAGSTSLRRLEALAESRGAGYLALANPRSPEEIEAWQRESVAAIGDVPHVVLAGHSMGGLAAILVSQAAGLSARVLALNTPCPDEAGRIPTMSGSADAEIAEILAGDGFPAEVLDDEEMLAEVAARVRADAVVADRMAAAVHESGQLTALHVLATRGDTFIGTERCACWRHRVSGEFQLVMTEGSHMLGQTPDDVLGRALDGVLASARGAAA